LHTVESNHDRIFSVYISLGKTLTPCAQAKNNKGVSPLDLAKKFCLTGSIMRWLEKPESAVKRKRKLPHPRLEYLVKGTTATYEPTGEEVEILKVHHEDEEPYFTVKMADGNEKQTTIDKLKPKEEERESKRRKVEAYKKNNVYVQGIPSDDPLMNGYFLERYFQVVGKVKNTKLYRTKEGTLKGDALVSFSKESEANAAVKKFNKSEIRAGHIITVTIADFSSDRSAKPAASTSRWGAQKFVPGAVAMVASGGLQGVLPSGLGQGLPPPMVSKSQMAAQKAAEIARQIESLKSVLAAKK